MADRRVRFNPMAEAELHDAAAVYDERSPGLGLRFIVAARKKIDELCEALRLDARVPARPPAGGLALCGEEVASRGEPASGGGGVRGPRHRGREGIGGLKALCRPGGGSRPAWPYVR